MHHSRQKPSGTVAAPVQAVLEAATRYASQPFLIDPGGAGSWTYDEFHRMAWRLALGLRARGFVPGDRLAILMGNSARYAALYFACLYAGVVAVPLNTQLSRREIATLLACSGARELLCTPETRAMAEASAVPEEVRVVCFMARAANASGPSSAATGPSWSLEDCPEPGAEGWRPLEGVTGDGLFTITFTSGTTSLPKGVPHRANSLLKSALLFNEAMGFGPDHRFYHVLPMAYMAGFLNTLLCPFLAGGSLVLGGTFDARRALDFWSVPASCGVNTLWLVPTMLTSLMRVDRDPVGRDYCRTKVQTVCVGTAPLERKLKRDFEAKYGVELLESYGLSETLFVALNRPAVERRDGSVGRVLPGVEVKVSGEDGQPVPPGVDGELHVRTPTHMVGYLDPATRQPAAVATAAWFPSGDVGHLDEDGYLFITGRKKDLIIRGGLNISPRAVEDVLHEHPAVDRAAVVGVPDAFYGEEVVAFLRLKAGHPLSDVRADLLRFCREQLNAMSVPSRVYEVEDFPSSSTGKIRKNELRDLALRSRDPT